MRCDFQPITDPADSGQRRYKCARCGQETAPTPFGPDRIHATCRIPGWGDYVAYYIAWCTGITKADMKRWFGGCKCQERQEKLNTWGERFSRLWRPQAQLRAREEPKDDP